MALRAGAAQRDLNPTSPMQLAGYPHVRRIATGVHDPLLAAALFLENGDQSILLCALDLLMLNADVTRRIRRRVAGQLGIPESGVFITCSHTHSAPVTLDYLPFVDDPAMPYPTRRICNIVKIRLSSPPWPRAAAHSRRSWLGQPPMRAASAGTGTRPMAQPIPKPACSPSAVVAGYWRSL